MTTREKFEQILYNKGIFESQAKRIMDFAIPEIDAQMREEKTSLITWNLPADGYPDSIYAVLQMTRLNKLVLRWAEENMPLAWWKPMFA